MTPTSGSATMPRIQSIAACAASPSTAATLMVPSSSMSILAPVVSVISRMTLPPEPMTSRIFSFGMLKVVIRGALSLTSSRGAGQRLGHLAEDMAAAVARLVQRDPHDLLGDRGDLDVHLQRGDALLGAGDLEVHVAEMVLVAEDVGQHGKAFRLP